HQLLGHHRAAYMFSNRYRRAQHGVRKNDCKLLAAVARRGILALDVMSHRHGNETQNLIAGEVAKVVVEGLEMIDVREHQRKSLVPLESLRDGFFKSDVEEFAVGQ